VERNREREFAHTIEALGRRVVDRHSKVMFFEEQGERVLIAMIAAAFMAHLDRFIERHLAVSGYSPEDLQCTAVHAHFPSGISLFSPSHWLMSTTSTGGL
jgi:hypothetical protein